MTSVADATTQLQDRYIESRFSSSVDEWPPYQPKHYTTLAFIHNKGKLTNAVRFFIAQELAVAGNINTSQFYKPSSFNVNMTRNISDIFIPVVASDGSFVHLHILIEGAPGIGKTVLAKEIAYQWAKNKLLKSTKLLLLVFLRECYHEKIKTIEKLIEFIFKSSEMNAHLTKYLNKTEGKDTVIVFDGFDELSEENREGSIIIDIINRRILTKCCLVVTSRPTASSILHEIVDRRVEIVGFTEEDRLNYIQTALGSDDKQVNGEQVNNEQVKALQHYLRSNLTINALCYIPLNMTILLCLVEDGINKLPKTQTEMYKKFIEMTIVRFIKKYEKSNIIINIAELLDPYKTLFVELAKLAYKALETDKIVFTLPEIKEGCPNLTMTSSNWNGLGLLKAVQFFSVQMGNDQVTFHFLHFSIQEYMAAWYISKLPDGKQIKLLHKTFWEHRYYNTWIMYVGITGGSSLALRHFLSGNHSQLYTKLSKTSKVSEKFLKHKMKCLHLFQCLVEAGKEYIIQSVKQLFENKQIDLSNQTLLPSDLNTLGFFLIRSGNKEWDELNLSYCNIGGNGSNILCDIFMNKDVCIKIKMVNFSYNQLDFSFSIRLFELFNSWHTSEVIISDDASYGTTIDSKTIENIVLQSNTLVLVLIISYLFCKNVELNKIQHILSNTTNIRSVYLLNCTWTLNNSALPALFEKQKLHKVRIITSSLNIFFINTLASILLNNNESVNMLVYDPTMSDQSADDISSFILSSYKDISGVMLIVSSSKLHGIVNTCSLSNELSALEIFNLSIYIRYLNNKMCPWREEHLEGNNLNKEIIITFITLLHKINVNWKLEITLWENNTVIVHKAKFKRLDNFKHLTKNKFYLSCCDIQYDDINESCSTLHILNSPECTELLHAKLLHKQFAPNELFIYGNIKHNLMNSLIKLLSHDYLNISAVLAVNDIIVGIHPSNELIALAFQLQPLPTTWILSTTDNGSVFYQVLDAIVINPTEWAELDFTGCEIGNLDCELVQRTFTYNNCSSTVRKLNISFNRLTESGMRDLARIVSISEVQELKINGTNDVLLDCLIKNLIRECQTGYFLSITYNHKILIVVCNTNWNEVAIEMNTQASEIYIINCDLQSEILDYLHTMHSLLKLCIINGSVSATIILEIIEFFSKETIEISICNISIIDDSEVIRNLFTNGDFCHHEKINLIISIENQWLGVYNVTKYQLHLIHQYFMNQTPPNHYGITLIRKLEQLSSSKIFDNNLVNLLFLAGNIRDNIMNTTIEFTSHDGHKISAGLFANNVVAGIYPSSKQIAVAFHSQPLSPTWIHCTAVSVNVFYQLIDMLAILHTKWTELDFTHCNIGDAECEIMHRTLRLNHSSPVRKMKISLNKLSVSGIPDLVRIILLWRVQELHINGTNDLLYNYLVKKLASENHNYSFLSITYNHKVIVWNADGNKIVTILNGLVSELLMINCNLQLNSEEMISYLNTTHNLLRLCLINGHVSVTTVTEILKSDKIGEVSISNARIIDDNRMRNLVTQRKFYLGIKISFMLSTSKWLCVYNITNYQLPLIHQYFINQAHLNCYVGMSLVRKLEQINGNKMYVFDNNLLNMIRIHAEVPQVPGATQIIAAIDNIVSLHTIEVNNYTITNETVNSLTNILHHNTQLQELYLNGNCLQADNIIAKILHSISTSSVCKNHITDDATSNCVATQTSTTSETNLETAYSTTPIKTMSLHSIATLTKFSICSNNIADKAACHISGVIFNNSHLQEVNLQCNDLQASSIIIVAGSLQKISTLTKLHINHSIINYKAVDDIAAAISCNTKLQEIDISGNILHIAGVRKIMIALQGIYTLKKLCLSHNNITDEAVDDIAKAISHNIHLQEFRISGNKLSTVGAIKIAKALQSVFNLRALYISDNEINSTAAEHLATAIGHANQLHELDISKNKFQARGIEIILKPLQDCDKLTKLYINDNNVTDDTAAHAIETVVSCNTGLQEIDISGNNLQVKGTINIAVALQSIVMLTKLCIRNNNMTYQAANNIAVVITHNVHLQDLDIGGNDLLAAGATIIAKSLQTISSLTKLYINNNKITSEAADDIAAAVFYNPHLEEFDISENEIEGSGAIKLVRSFQQISALKKLFVDHNMITDEAADDIAAAISCNTELQEIDISENNFHTAGVIKIMKALQEIHTLKKLCLGNNNINGKAADDIAAVISCNTKLQEIDISMISLDKALIKKIMKPLQGIHTLKKLYLSHNNISDEEANDIATVISLNRGLEEFNISKNNLQTRGVKKITKALRKIDALIILNLSNNNVTNKAADDIAAAISCNTKLQEIDISENNLHTAGVIKIMKALQGIYTLKKLCLSHNNIDSKAADDIAAAISCNVKLQEIDIRKNHLQTTGFRKIVKALQGIYSLKKLCLSNNIINGEAADDIAAAVSFSTSLQEIDISGSNLQTRGVKRIAEALSKIYDLEKLNLSNSSITNTAADYIAAAISCNTKLQEIDISENNLHTASVRKIMKALQGIHTLKKLCLGNNNINDEAADDIAAVISCNTKLQEIDISENNLHTAGVIKIMKALQRICTLKKLCLGNNNINGKAADDIAAVISCNTKLQEIDISMISLDKALIKKIMKPLQGIHTLKKLYLSHNNISDEEANDIATVISLNRDLEEFNISKNNFQTRGVKKIAKALRKSDALKKLNLSNNNVTNEAADDIAAAISCNTTLQEIDISENNLHTAGVIKIMKALQGIYTLKKLCLSHNNMDSKAADDIAAAISFNASLQEIDVSRNNLQTRGAKKITEALGKVYVLEKLNLSYTNITCEAADDIAAVVLFNTSLQEIDTSGNGLQTNGVIKIARALQTIYPLTKLCLSNNNITDEAVDDIAKVISHNIHLQEFRISGNKLSTVGAIKIAKALQNVFNLRALYISDNEIDSTAAEHLATAIGHANQLHELDISKNKFQARGIEIILKPLQDCDKLTKLYINDNDVTDDTVTHVIGDVISCITGLREIDISGNNLQVKVAINIAVALQSIVMLTKLCISNNNMTWQAANDIAVVITHNVHLQDLDIGGNDLLAAGATIIAKSLQTISSLTKLYINNNKITSEAADDIAAAVSCNPYLEEFDISENEIKGSGAIKLVRSFQQISTLKKLFVDHNMITDEAADDFAYAISHNPHVNAFEVTGNLLLEIKL